MNDDLLAQGQPGNPRAEARFMVLALLAGGLTGFIGSLFHEAIDRAVAWPDWLALRLDGWALVGASAGIAMAGAVIAVVLVRRFAPEAGGSGVQEIEGAMEGLREVRWRRVLPVKFVAGVIAIGSGLVLGREGPTIHIGASASAAVAETFRTTELERRGLLASGAAAGLSCAFNAPLASVLFVVEETHKEFPYTFRTYLGVIIATIASTVVTEIMGGTRPDLPLAAAAAPLAFLPAFLLLGVLIGVVGRVLNAAILHAVGFAAWSQQRLPYAYPAAVGAAVGALFILLPQAVTGGEGGSHSSWPEVPGSRCCWRSRRSASSPWWAAIRAGSRGASSRRSCRSPSASASPSARRRGCWRPWRGSTPRPSPSSPWRRSSPPRCGRRSSASP